MDKESIYYQVKKHIINSNSEDTDWLISRCETTTERYIEAEEFILNLKWWERVFISGKIHKFMKSRLTKYKF